MVYKWYILPIGGLYITYHLLWGTRNNHWIVVFFSEKLQITNLGWKPPIQRCNKRNQEAVMCHASWGSSKHTIPSDPQAASTIIMRCLYFTLQYRTSDFSPDSSGHKNVQDIHQTASGSRSVLRHLRELAAGSWAFPHFCAMRRFPVLEETLIVERFSIFGAKWVAESGQPKNPLRKGGGKSCFGTWDHVGFPKHGNYNEGSSGPWSRPVNSPEIQRRSWQVDRRS